MWLRKSEWCGASYLYIVVSVDEHARKEMWLRKSECCGASYLCIVVSVDEHARCMWLTSECIPAI